jgi:cytochrome c biogenesis protein CcmG/thiol:disulfide interchange protein DsbE
VSSRTHRPPRPPAAPAPRPSSNSHLLPLLLIGGVAAVVILAFAVALVAGSRGDDRDTASSGDPASGDATGPLGAADVPDDTPATVTGDDLPPLSGAGSDPAVGSPMPTLTGTGMDGEPLTVPTAGRPTMIMYVAHWCPHCQAEVPVVQRWVDDGGLPDEVDLVTVSTAVDSRRPNHPPAAWLDGEGWTAPVLVDGDDSAAQAAGLTAFPFFVAVDADGDVVGRTSGELTPTQLDGIVEDLTAATS